jgi:four helix bundle protein
MTGVRRFEEFTVWQRSRRLAARIDEACSHGRLAANFGLKDQMRRAGLSIMSNIAEGFERRSPRQFRFFLVVAKGSAAELRAQLYLCLDRAYLDAVQASELLQETEEVSRMIGGLIRSLTSRGAYKNG